MPSSSMVRATSSTGSSGRTVMTPDVIADFSRILMTELARDRIAVDGASGRERPETLKVTLGFLDGFIGEGQI